VITGGGGGLGSSTARLLAPSNDLLLVDSNVEALERSRAAAAAIGDRVETSIADLESVDACEWVIEDCIARMGRVDILINTAAILARRAFADVTAESFDQIFHVIWRAPFFLARAAMADMEKRGWGRIVNITSTAVYEGGMNMTSAPYEGTKGAISVFTKMLARHGAPNGILVNSVCPGGMRTAMLLDGTPPEVVKQVEARIPLGRLADPVEVGSIIAWLVGDQNTYATGATFDVNGGLVMP
jgi:3-oxoacyl-[acyl-carrier protein] reductase